MKRRIGFRRVHRGWAVLPAIGIIIAGPQPVAGLNIVLEFNDAASDNPAYDPDGSALTSLLESAVSYYEDIFKETHTLTIRYWWEDLPSGVLGVHQGTFHDGQRELRANLRFDTTEADGDDRRWYFDPTPFDHSEFDVRQTLVSDLSNPSTHFNGDPPDTFEVGYRGVATTSAPSLARSGFDLLTVALHEIGHGLGVPAASAANNETDDGDWDTAPEFLGGASIGIRTAGSTNQGPFHIKAGAALMSPSVATGLRELPSATDVLAMASTAGWTQIDLPRKDFLGDDGDDEWGTAGHWIGNRVPDAQDDVFLRHGGSIVSLVSPSEAGNLTVDGVTTLKTLNQTLTVAGHTRLDAGAHLVVGDDANPAAVGSGVGVGVGVTTGTLELGVGGQALTLAGGTLAVTAGPVTLGADDSLIGMGTIDASVSSSGSLSPGLPGLGANDGSVTISGDLTILDGQVTIDVGPNGHDQFSVLGQLTLGGLLDVQLAEGFTPRLGQVFNFFTAGGIVDGFAFEAFQGDLFRLANGTTALVPVVDPDLGVVSLVTTVVGDINGDKVVGFADFEIIESNFDSAGGWFDGDLSGDGLVNFLDFTLLQSHYGQSVSGARQQVSPRGNLLIPEPGSAAAAILMGSLLLGGRSSRARTTNPGR